jgi:hypothetical protein
MFSFENIRFDSKFESGNLLAVFKKGDYEFDLILENDINTRGNTQWFFFSMRNLSRKEKVRLNIINFVFD